MRRPVHLDPRSNILLTTMCVAGCVVGFLGPCSPRPRFPAVQQHLEGVARVSPFTLDVQCISLSMMGGVVVYFFAASSPSSALRLLKQGLCLIKNIP
jgi:hypothetical protein